MSTKSDPTSWVRSSYSAQGANCVEVSTNARTCAVRDSKNPTGRVLAYSSGEWAAFLQAVKAGAHDLP
ncbi:DUF397 domain-containing protein [Actinomadura geliboluensis]|uniref:DUF397 domain-containing protein n=1 Tax=Actinomadura geliboluensis TaxID=882440 RepID=UPI00371BB7A5